VRKNLLTTLLFEFFGGLFLYYSLPMGMGTLTFIGPGFAPAIISIILMIVGIIVLLIPND